MPDILGTILLSALGIAGLIFIYIVLWAFWRVIKKELEE